MPIPEFDGITNVLPPFLNNPTLNTDLTPYDCTFEEICERFDTSRERNEILRGLLALRARLVDLGISGFQWIDGSFVENVEEQEGRPPKDIDVVTFVDVPRDQEMLSSALRSGVDLLDSHEVKKKFKVDHFIVPLGGEPFRIVELTRYWTGLFSHRRDGVWKGMLRTELNCDDDAKAKVILKVKS